MFAAVDFDLYVGLAVAGDTVDFGLGSDAGDGASFLTSFFPGEEGCFFFILLSFLTIFCSSVFEPYLESIMQL